jgi:hypothetical protein
MSVLFMNHQFMRRNTMPLVTRTQRVFFAVICVAALLVAVLGLFNPGYLASIFTWLELPPLHARFVGAIYAFGAVFMAGSLVARYQAEVRWAVQLIGIWTGMLFIISLLNLNVFDFNLLPVQVWFASYIIYPFIIFLDDDSTAPPDESRRPSRARARGLAKRLFAHPGHYLFSSGSGVVLCSGVHDNHLAVASDPGSRANVRGSAFILRAWQLAIFAPKAMAGRALYPAWNAGFHRGNFNRFLSASQPLLV